VRLQKSTWNLQYKLFFIGPALRFQRRVELDTYVARVQRSCLQTDQASCRVPAADRPGFLQGSCCRQTRLPAGFLLQTDQASCRVPAAGRPGCLQGSCCRQTRLPAGFLLQTDQAACRVPAADRPGCLQGSSCRQTRLPAGFQLQTDHSATGVKVSAAWAPNYSLPAVCAFINKNSCTCIPVNIYFLFLTLFAITIYERRTGLVLCRGCQPGFQPDDGDLPCVFVGVFCQYSFCELENRFRPPQLPAL
jgi:hypothetical protein